MTEQMNCIGVDFGWMSGASGLAWLVAGPRGVRFVETARIADVREVVEWVDGRAGADGVVAVDAPLQLGNVSGMREAERAAHRSYGRYDAGCYPAHQGSVFAGRTTGFSRALAERGFVLSYEPFRSGRRQFECFPHIVSVEMFQLDRILKYKKGPRAARGAALAQLRELIGARLAIEGLELPQVPERGDLKDTEDRLDAILCAYSAYWWWRWGYERNRVLGNPEEGCIIVPVAGTESGGRLDYPRKTVALS
jgi:predicted RNase H-like nuclease